MSDNGQPVAAGEAAVQTGAQEVQEQINALNGTEPAQETDSPQQEPQAEAQKPKEDDRFAAKFAALSRKEKQLRQREQQAEQRLKEAEQRIKEAEEKFSLSQTWKESVKKDPFKALEDAGLTYNELIERSIRGEGQELTPEQKMIKEIETKFEQRLAEELQKRDQEVKRQQEQLRMFEAQKLEKQLKTDIQKFLESKKDDLPLISMDDDAVQTVFDAMDEMAKEEPVQSYEEAVALMDKAAGALEKYYEEEISKRARHPKIQGLLGVQAKPINEPGKTVNKSATLSNSLSQQAAVPSSAANMSDEASKSYAASMLKWED